MNTVHQPPLPLPLVSHQNPNAFYCYFDDNCGRLGSLIQRIDKTKDVDGLHACNVGNLISACQPAFRPCTSSGIMHALRQTLPGGTSSNTFLEGQFKCT